MGLGLEGLNYRVQVQVQVQVQANSAHQLRLRSFLSGPLDMQERHVAQLQVLPQKGSS